MPPVTIVSSDQPATLVERLAHDLGAAPLDPFAVETIVVQSRGTERWIRHELARRLGCAASLHFPFAASFFTALARSLAPGEPGGALQADRAEVDLARDAIVWRILDLLENGVTDRAGYEPLRRFVGDSVPRDGRKLLGLAAEIAQRFEECALYRPDVMVQWDHGEGMEADPPHARWQRDLWTQLGPSIGPDENLARLWTDAARALDAATACPPGLPTRLSVFGVSTLPPVFAGLLHAVARHVPVRLYLQAPPRTTWEAQLELANRDRRDGRTVTRAQNPLFATFGTVVRQLVVELERPSPGAMPVVLEEHHARREHHEESEKGAHAPDRPATMLATLQSDVRAGIRRGPAAGDGSPVPLDPDHRDESLAIHRCHSPMREMEVLRDQLLAAFAADPSLRPHDVLVLLPDVTTYAPFVEAVFGVGEPGLPLIPHRIADRPITQESRIADGALRILRLVGARWTAAELVALLDLPAVQRAAGLSEGATARIIGWIEATNIRWGRDGAMRREIFNLPGIEANSWRAGIDRLLMGYATGRLDDLVADVLPCAGDTIGDPHTLGAFARFLDLLFDTLTEWRTARSLPEWAASLRAAFGALLLPDGDDEESELDVVLGAVDSLAAVDTGATDARAFELGVIRDWLEQVLECETLSAGFLSGGMTVCALKPMRVVPHRIVAIAGLDDATFPRQHQRRAFDLMALSTRDCDRDRRADDRQLFLDTLLATGDRLILSYVANSSRNNGERAVSVVVAELLDVVDRSFTLDVGGSASTPLRTRDTIEVQHRLQPFSAMYFGADRSSRLFSYSRTNARALASASQPGGTAARPFVTGPLPLAVTRMQGDIQLRDLIAGWSNPGKFYCTRALGIRLISDGGMSLDECEPMTVNALDRYKVHDTMLQRHLRGVRLPERDRAEALALGVLPSGALAGVWYDHLDAELTSMLESLGTPAFEDPVALCLEGEGWTLVGQVDAITGSGRLQVRAAACKAKDKIEAWITHLALTAAHGPVTTRLVGRNEEHSFGELTRERAMTELDVLVAGYRAMLCEPLPFFADASFSYADYAYAYELQAAGAKATRKTKPAMQEAREKFDGTEFGEYATGDASDPYVALAWRGRDPLAEQAESFAEWSLRFWRPALEAMQCDGAGA